MSASALHPHEVIGEKRAHEPFVLGDRRHDERRRHRYVQEKADRVAASHRAQLGRERNEMVVVHPDDVVGLEQRKQTLREELIHAAIAARESHVELREIEPVMEHRPQNVIGVAEIVAFVILLAEIYGGELDLAGRLQMHATGTACARGIVDGLAAPSEPHAAGLLQAVLDRHGQPTGCGFARVCHAIRHYNETAH